MADVTTVKTPVVRLSFPNLFVPRAVEEGQDKKYSCTLIFDKAAQADPKFREIKLACATAARKKWGDNIPKGMHSPFIAAEKLKKPMEGVEPGSIIIRCSSKMQPGLVDRKAETVTDQTFFYAGCFVIASLNAYAWNNKLKGDGVSLGLNNLQRVRDGESLGGRVPATHDFKPLDDDGEMASAGGGKNDLDDEIPF